MPPFKNCLALQPAELHAYTNLAPRPGFEPGVSAFKVQHVASYTTSESLG